MGSETNSPSSGAKRSRDPEDEVYLDNLHSHKRYLSEIMASSLNGLTVGDALPETIMDSPARSESMYYMRDDVISQYSPMSEDLSDDAARFCETPAHNAAQHFSIISQAESSRPTSPVSPYRYKPLNAFCASPPHPLSPTTNTTHPSSSNNSFPTALPSLSTTSSSSSQPRQQRGGSSSDTEGRFPSSPSDICHSSDLRRAALLRSVQMRSSSNQPAATGSTCATVAAQSPFEAGFGSLVGHHHVGVGVQNGEIRDQSEEEEQELQGPSCSPYMKSVVDGDRDYSIDETDGCSSMAMTMSEPECDDDDQGKLCRDLGVGKTSGISKG